MIVHARRRGQTVRVIAVRVVITVAAAAAAVGVSIEASIAVGVNIGISIAAAANIEASIAVGVNIGINIAATDAITITTLHEVVVTITTSRVGTTIIALFVPPTKRKAKNAQTGDRTQDLRVISTTL